IKILKQAGKDLAYFVIKTHQHLNMQASFWLGFRGSFIQNALFVKEELMSCLKNDGLKPRLVEEENDSVIGAYYLAKQKGLI
ncbi:MAG TPA: ATPase, partial [Bacilli bacterium]|nr:ATPase [Bacilli bacterium]